MDGPPPCLNDTRSAASMSGGQCILQRITATLRRVNSSRVREELGNDPLQVLAWAAPPGARSIVARTPAATINNIPTTAIQVTRSSNAAR